jgi:hypothetical protein
LAQVFDSAPPFQSFKCVPINGRNPDDLTGSAPPFASWPTSGRTSRCVHLQPQHSSRLSMQVPVLVGAG